MTPAHPYRYLHFVKVWSLFTCWLIGAYLIGPPICITELQVTLAVLISGWAHVLHAIHKPWGVRDPMYILQHFSLLVTTFVFLMGLLFKVGRVSTPLQWPPPIPRVGVCCVFCDTCRSSLMLIYGASFCNVPRRTRESCSLVLCPLNALTPWYYILLS